uniref:NADH-ubiquinone oxidoreductase chain 2 n=1 Tax=Cucujoidea sp. 36 KM-2017 TaxID=2219374 RepID=A0A346RIV4_9CUCU|nr:NADH dehydrogenase subunit 2 [Cucujoidea sp. 36 KM-2017]
MIKFYKFLFFNMMILGTLIAISSYSWFSMWLGLEINLLSVIPLFNSMKNYFPSESALKYFITQSMASTIILFSILNFINENEMIFMKNNLNLIIFNSALLTKMGAAPFHYWFPEIMEGLSWMNNLIVLTWQKLAPFMIISYNIQPSIFIMFSIICSSLIGGIMGFNQISLRKLLTFSSINHIAWMMSSMFISNWIWFLYFFIYTLISFILILSFNYFNMIYIYQLFNIKFNSNNINFIFLLNFFSLGGLPPFLGFLPKWLTINGLNIMNLYMISFILIILTLITLYFYIRITFYSLMFINNELMTYKFKIMNFTLMMISSLNLIGLMIIPLIFN